MAVYAARNGVSWWRKTDLETARDPGPAAKPPAGAADRLERAFASELTSSMSLNLRGTGGRHRTGGRPNGVARTVAAEAARGS